MTYNARVECGAPVGEFLDGALHAVDGQQVNAIRQATMCGNSPVRVVDQESGRESEREGERESWVGRMATANMERLRLQCKAQSAGKRRRSQDQ